MIDLLRQLCALPCVSGDEFSGKQDLLALLEPLGKTEILPNGTVLCYLPTAREDLPVVMLAAHLDRIGLMVTRISDRGFVHAAAVGGVDRRSLAGARVTIHTKDGPKSGVVCSVPPHLADGSGKLQSSGDVAIDMGLTAARARELVGYGDRVTFDGAFTPLLGDRICAPALDDRAGCAAILRAGELLQGCETAAVVLAFTAQEEVGSSGASTAAAAVRPDFCFAVDVTFGSTPDSDPNETLQMGGGPAIGFSPILDRRLCELLRRTAERCRIRWQAEVMAGRTGTDADHIAIAGRGVRTALVSIPERYMHTAGEVVSLADVGQTALLLAKTIGGGL
jgi:endoglucanase